MRIIQVGLITSFLICTSIILCHDVQARPSHSNAQETRVLALEAVEACSIADQSEPYRRGRFLCLRGYIDQSYRDGFLALMPEKGDVVVASGVGGEADAAMDIGDVIFDKDILVVVDAPCASSCAYFLALGSKSLAFVGEGLLGFHGGPIPEDDILQRQDISSEAKIKLLATGHRFRKFFERRGHDISITNKIPEGYERDEDWRSTMWVRLPPELPAFGVRSVVLCDGSFCGS